MSGGSSGGANSTQVPAWLKGLQVGQQIAQSGQAANVRQVPGGMPPGLQMQGMQRPVGQLGGMQQGVVPGSVAQQPMMQPGMGSAGMGMQQQGMPAQQGQQQINPQLLQMLMRARGM